MFNSGWSEYSVAQGALQFNVLQGGGEGSESERRPHGSICLRELVEEIVRNLAIPLLQHFVSHER